MYTKRLAFLALVAVVRCHDVIDGLRTDGTKFFDENRQANPALWRQMDNVTINAPENEVIRRVVITDQRPEKDGDVKIVEGGEGHKNVTIELKSPTVLRGYDFHIEAYSSPDDQSPLSNDQSSTVNVNEETMKTTEQSVNTPEFDTTSKMPESSDKDVPAIITKDDEVIDSSEREGRSARNEDNTPSEGTTEASSTTIKSDVSTTLAAERKESVTDNSSEKNSDVNTASQSPVAPIPSNKNFDINPAFPAVTVREIFNNTEDAKAKDTPRNARDIEETKTEKPTEKKLNPASGDLFTSTTENNNEASTTEVSDVKPVEEKSEDGINAPKVHTFETRKYTSFIPSKAPGPLNPIEVKDEEKQRNARDASDENTSESSSTESFESTTADLRDAETTTLTNDDCVTMETVSDHTDVNNPINVGNEAQGVKVPLYINRREWTQRFNNPREQAEDSAANDDKSKEVLPVQSNQSTPEVDSESLGNGYDSSPDHMENRNPKITAVTNFKNKNEKPVISLQ